MSVRVKSVRHIRDHVLELQFSDGSHGQIDFRNRVVGRGGVFTALEEIDTFRNVRVDTDAGTITWPNGVDFCPDALHHEATGAPLPRLPESHRAA